jgi:DNA-directed RNA polymerase subunit D
MKIIQKTKEKVVFSADIDESLANAIRRSVSEIPILAIDEVEIYKNDSALYDEVIANRLGLTPLVMEKGMNMKEDCSCKGKDCGKCTVELKLSKTGPGIVYSSDLKGKAEIVYEKIPIDILREDQEIELVAYARLGKGKSHAKFTPGLFYYRNLANIEIKNAEALKKCSESCPLGLISGDSKDIKEIWKCDMCEACVEACKKEGIDGIKITPEKELVFFIESWGQIDAAEIFNEAVDVLRDNLRIVNKA